MTEGLFKVNEATMVAAHAAGVAYWTRNWPFLADVSELASHARSCGWHGELNDCWLAGFLGARSRARHE